MTFSETYERFIHDIEASALSQHVKGHDYDDIVAEMLGCLWKAWQTYDSSKGRFGPYWWSLWLNRRRDLNLMHDRLKRPVTYAVSNEFMSNAEAWIDRIYSHQRTPDVPTDGPKAKAVWVLLSNGFTPSEVMEAVGLSKRAYYKVIGQWRTEEVHRLLT